MGQFGHGKSEWKDDIGRPGNQEYEEGCKEKGKKPTSDL
jgi:hypothetical protein